MITPCKTLSVFVYSRLRLHTCVCIEVCEISLHIYALMPQRALNILLLCVCVCVFPLPITWRLNLLVLMTSSQSRFHVNL